MIKEVEKLIKERKINGEKIIPVFEISKMCKLGNPVYYEKKGRFLYVTLDREGIHEYKHKVQINSITMDICILQYHSSDNYNFAEKFPFLNQKKYFDYLNKYIYKKHKKYFLYGILFSFLIISIIKLIQLIS